MTMTPKCEDRPMETQPETPCGPGGNYGLCHSHPTCGFVRAELDRLRAEVRELTTSRDAARAALAQRDLQWSLSPGVSGD